MKFNIFSKLIFNNFVSINFLGHTTDERAAALCPSSTTTIPTANQKIPTTTATEKRRWMPPLWTDIESRCWARFQEKRCEVRFRMVETRWDDWEMKTQPRPLQLRLFQDLWGHRGRMIAIRYYDCQDWAFYIAGSRSGRSNLPHVCIFLHSWTFWFAHLKTNQVQV